MMGFHLIDERVACDGGPPKHIAGALRVDPGPDWVLADGQWRLTDEARRRRVAKLEAAAAQNKLQLQRVPRKYWDALRHPTRTAALAAVQELTGRRCLVILLGPADSSKSFAAAWLVAARGGLFVACARLLDVWHSATGRSELLTAPALALDDIGQGGGSHDQHAARAEALEEIVHARAEQELPVVMTTQLRPELLEVWCSRPRTEEIEEIEACRHPRAERPPLALASARWVRLGERMTEHGVEPSPRIAALGGRVPLTGVVHVPHEGFRHPERRASVLREREDD